MISYQTGDLLWQYSDTEIVSNFETVGDEIFVLDIDADLLRLDFMTGSILERIELENPLEMARDSSISTETIEIALLP